jgi:hypothetical protein
MNADLYQIYYKPEQKEKLYPFAIPYFNEPLTIFFENTPIRDIVSKYEGEKLAVCSWKLSKKVRIIHPVTEEALNRDYQVLSLTRNSQRHQMLAMANAWHPGFIKTIDLLWQKVGLKRPPEAKNPIYQNHFSARVEIYRDYVNNFLIPAMEVTETDEELNKLMTQPSGYARLSKTADAVSVKEKLGLSDYPLAPFILERSPSLFFQMRGYKISYI